MSTRKKLREDLPRIVDLIFTKIKKTVFDYAIDDEGEEWNKEIVKDEYSKKFDKLFVYKHSLAKVILNCENKEYEILVSVKTNEATYCGLLFQISENCLFKEDYSKENIKLITDKIINLMYKMHGIYEFDYAFCDCEADIEYSPNEIISKMESPYSILLWEKSSGELELILNNWNIDGLTPRMK